MSEGESESEENAERRPDNYRGVRIELTYQTRVNKKKAPRKKRDA